MNRYPLPYNGEGIVNAADNREVVRMRKTRRGHGLTRIMAAVIVGVLAMPYAAWAEDGIGGAGDETVDQISMGVLDSGDTVSDEQPPVKITAGGQTGEYETILEALEKTTGESTRVIELSGDVTDPGFNVFSGTNLTLHLNGHTLTQSGSVTVYGQLTIIDQADSASVGYDTTTAIVTNPHAGEIVLTDSKYYLAATNGGTINFVSGNLINASGNAVRVTGEGSSLTLTDGYIHAKDSYAVSIDNGGKFVQDGGVVEAVDYAALSGDAALKQGNTEIIINGGYVISKNENTEDTLVGVGACQVMDNGKLTINGGEIRSIGNGVGVVVDQGSFEMHNGRIYGDGDSFEGQTPTDLSIGRGYGLVLNCADADTLIDGGFISGMEKSSTGEAYPVPSTYIATNLRARSIAGVGVSIEGGTFTNPETAGNYGIGQCLKDESYKMLGHSASGREKWITVLKLVKSSEEISNAGMTTGAVAEGRTANIFYGQIDYYRDVTDAKVWRTQDADGTWVSNSHKVYADYPTYRDGEIEYVFTGWFTSQEGAEWTDGVEQNGEVTQTRDYLGDSATIGEAFAKLSDPDLINARMQLSSNLWNGNKTDDDSADILVSAIIDSVNFQSVGIRVAFQYAADDGKTLSANNEIPDFGPSLIYIDQNSQAVTLNANQVNAVAVQIGGVRFSDIDVQRCFKSKLQSATWWQTLDGTYVMGGIRSNTIKSYLDANYPNHDLGTGEAVE